MDSLDFDKPVVLEALVVGKDASGGMTKVWAPSGTPAWAAIRNFSGEEKRSTSVGGETPIARTEITMGWRAGITASMRVRYGSIVYNIRHVNDWQEQHRRLVLTCDTGVTYTGA